MFGSIITTALTWKYQQQKTDKEEKNFKSVIAPNGIFIVLNLLVILPVIWITINADKKGIYIFIFLTSLFLVILIASLVAGTARFYFKVVVLITGAMYLMPFLYPQESSVFLSDGLRFFGSGNVSVCLISTDRQSPFEMKGELVFLSPKYVYLKKSETDQLMIVPRKDSLNIIYEEKKKEK
jgi:hypothetical protein